MSGREEYLKEMVPDELANKFQQVRLHIRVLSFVKGFALLAGCLFVSFFIAVVLDRAFRMGSPYRLAVLIAAVMAMLFIITRYIFVPLLRRYTARRIAVSVEEVNPQLGDSLLTTIELAEEYANGTLKTSSELVKAHAQVTYESTHAIDFRSIVPFRTVLKVLIFAFITTALVIGFYIAETPIAKNVLARILQPFSGPEPFTYTKISVQPGSTFMQKGDGIEVSARISGRVPEHGYIYWKSNSNSWERIRLAQKNDGLEHEFISVLTPVQYKFHAGDSRSDIYTITPVTSPAVIGITPRVLFPEYTRVQPRTLRDTGGLISAVRGSKVIITALTNKPCTKANIIWINGKKFPMKISGSTLESPRLDIDRTGTYRFELTDELEFYNVKPIYYRVEAMEDQSPTVVVEKPSQYSEATPDAIALIVFSVLDDFGVGKVWVDYTINKRPEAEEADILPEHVINGSADINLEEAGSNSIHADFNFLLTNLLLESGDVITFKLKARDEDILTGPNTGESEQLKIKIISDEESFSKIEREQQDIQRRIKWLLKKQADTEETVEELAETLKRRNKLDKSDEESLVSARESQQEIENTDREIADDIEKIVSKMQQNPMIGLRSIIQMNDIQEALEDLADREMADATVKMQNAEKARQSSVKSQQLDEAGELQDEIIQKLEEIDEQLTKMREEQRLASLANAARGIAKKQDRNMKETAEARGELSGMIPEEMTRKNKRRLKKLVDEEKKLYEQLEQLERRMHRTSEQMKYSKSGGSEDVDRAMQQMKNENISDDMKEAEEHLRANHLNKAMQAQKKASKKLWDMVRTLEKQKQDQFSTEFMNMQAQMRARVSEIDRLIELQQGIIDETVILPVGDETDPLNDRHLSKFMDVSASQEKLYRRTDEFARELEMIFENLIMLEIDPVSPLKKAVVSMDEATKLLVQLKQPASLESEKEAFGRLLKAREELARALSKLIQEAQMQQMMQQMSIIDEMIEKQLKINQDTKLVDDKIKPEQTIPDSLQRLTKKLSRLQKELADTADSLKGQLEQMKEISELMQEISKILNELKTGSKTQSMQEEVVEKLVRELMQLQMQMIGAAQAMGMSGRGGGGSHGGIQLPPRFKDKPEGISDDQWARLPENLRKQLLDAWSEDYPPKFRRLLNVYYRRLSSEEDR